MSTNPETLKKAQWTIKAFDLASKPAEFIEKPSASRRDGLDLAPQTGKAATPEVSIADLAKLQKEARAILDTLVKLAAPDPEAEGSEWKGVTDACAAVRTTLDKRELRSADLDTAKKQLAEIAVAKQKAHDAIQVRLTQAAQPLRDAAAKAKTADVDAKGKEWDTVVAACNAVEAALPKVALKKADIAKAQLEADKIAGVVALARTAIQDRLKLEAQGVRDKLAPLAAVDPEARGDEWNAVTAAAKAVEVALPSGTLSNAHIATATQKLMGVSLAAGDARQKIQTRLAAQVKAIRDDITPFRTADPQARGTEWDRVRAACDKAEVALPTGTLKAALLEPARTLQKRIPVVAQVVRAAIQQRLRKEAAAVLAELSDFQTPEPGGKELWGPVTEACQKVTAAIPKGTLTAADITEARRLLGLVGPTLAPVCEALWAKDVEAAKKRSKDALGEPRKGDKAAAGLLEFLKGDAVIKVYTAKAGTSLVPADLPNYRTQKAELQRLTDAACAQIDALRKGLTDAGLAGATADPDTVKATLEAKNRRHLAQYGMDQLRARGDAELVAILAAQAEANKKHAFRTHVATADAALTKAAEKLLDLHKAVTTKGTKDWKKGSFLDKLQGPTFSVEDLATAELSIKLWNEALDKDVAERKRLELSVTQTVATYADATPPAPLDQLEALRDAVAKHLASTRAKAIRNALTQTSKILPLSVWTKALDEALKKQIATPVAGTVWAGRFGLGHDKGESWGIDNTGNVDGKPTHLTLYPNKVEASCEGTPAAIVEAIIGRDVNGIHVTQEWYSKDDPKNPRVYRGTTRNLQNLEDTRDAMYTILDGYIATFEPIAKEWKDRAGLSVEQLANNKLYLAELEAEIDKLS